MISLASLKWNGHTKINSIKSTFILMEKGFKHYLKETGNDIPAGLVVFLVALPLCLGISLASGASLFSGVISGIVGGIVVGFLSGSHLSVSGPAAGLTIIVLEANKELGSFELFLLAVVIAGAFQILLGVVKAGIIALYFPTSVIKGMLAAIGLILIFKQIPHFLGVDIEAFGDDEFTHDDGHTTVSEFFYSLYHFQWGAAIIGFSSLFVLIFWESVLQKNIKGKWFKFFPGALAVVILGAGINEIFKGYFPSLIVEKTHLVGLPNLLDKEVLRQSFHSPAWNGLMNPLVWQTALIIALIASLETLLSIEAVDKLDPHKRFTPPNRELVAQGVGNMFAGLLGGLPLTAVIVRSSANVSAGGQTKMATVYHGFFLLISVVFIPFLLNYIPYASLAAILLMVGYKLSKPKLYIQQYKNGYDQIMPFMATVVAIFFTDLLIGVMIGLGVGIFFILRANFKTPYYYRDEDHPHNGQKHIVITLSEHVSFINKASLQITLNTLPEDSTVTIDGSNSEEIDFDALNIIHDFKTTAQEKNIALRLIKIPEMSLN
jgi:MFS superfamily sulfate permease-like transporter